MDLMGDGFKDYKRKEQGRMEKGDGADK